jgi:hypothetical protein
MKSQPDFSEEIRTVVEEAGGKLEGVDTRVCAGQHDGCEYTLYGSYIPIRPILQFVREKGDFAIESMQYNTESERARLLFFLADLRTPELGDDPAFTKTKP